MKTSPTKLLFGIFFIGLLLPQFANAAAIDDAINAVFEPIAQSLTSFVFFPVNLFGYEAPLVVLWLMFGASFFTFYFGFINVRGFMHGVNLLRGRYSDHSDPGEISHFKALSTALSGTIGLGNIAGVAVAISIGGAGATLWMIVAGFLGMSSKFVECTLGLKYRHTNADGSVSGGPMYYLERGLAEKNLARFGKVLAVAFSICCIGGAIGTGNLFQANQAYEMVASRFSPHSLINQHAWVFGLGLALLVAVVIIGGIKSIARVAAKLVPFMALIYIVAAVLIICLNIHKLPEVIVLIFDQAFSLDAGMGGLIGAMINGFKRALFSSEAGIGSAPIVHATAKTKQPVSEGLVSLLEPFIDTVVICTLTALLILLSGAYQVPGVEGVHMAASAFDQSYDGLSHLLTLVVFLFAFSTLLTWSYYGTQAVVYLLGNKPWVKLGFQCIFCALIVVGVTLDLRVIVDFSDGMFFMMCFFNLLGIYFLAPDIKQDLADYLNQVKS